MGLNIYKTRFTIINLTQQGSSSTSEEVRVRTSPPSNTATSRHPLMPTSNSAGVSPEPGSPSTTDWMPSHRLLCQPRVEEHGRT